jgi:ribosomal protein S18 acetylase RimI-like enzyme
MPTDFLKPEDLPALRRLAHASGLYSPAQLDWIAQRGLGFANGQRVDDYEAWVSRAEAGVNGFLVFRKRALTEAAFEIGQLGGDRPAITELLAALQSEIIGRGGKLIFAELPDGPHWEPIFDELRGAGYRLAGSTPHLYAPGAGARHYALHLDRAAPGPTVLPDPDPAHAATPSRPLAPTLPVIATPPEHRAAILEMAASTTLFTKEDREVVQELLEAYLLAGPEGDYRFLSCVAGEALVAFACYGPRASTSGAYDLYWICADARRRQQGAGRSLMAAIEAEVLRQGGYLMLLETLDSSEFTPARKFYEALGYRRLVHIARFYSEREGMVLYARHLRPVG